MTFISTLPAQQEFPLVTDRSRSDDPLWRAAQKLETTFIAEMLKSIKLDQSPSSFGGGAGEEQFSSFLYNSQADHISQAGGLGLAETFFNAMRRIDHVG